jgi:hypothetical protein
MLNVIALLELAGVVEAQNDDDVPRWVYLAPALVRA